MAIGNTNIFGANSTTGEAPSTSLDQLLSVTDAQPQLNGVHTEQVYGAVQKAGGNAQAVLGTDSIFNPFYVFRYAKYGSITGNAYSPDYHRDINDIAKTFAEGGVKDVLAKIQEDKHVTENPSSGDIIRWAAESADQNKGGTTLGPTPYQWNDFLWCKWYGKMPNNRMLTLRRYPIPVEDNLQIASSKAPLVPLAQAVTWWGGDTGNKLSSILGFSYGWKWKPLTTDIKDVTGNEISAESLLDAAGLTQADSPTLRKILLATLFDNPDNPYESTGYDEKLQTWIKSAYGSEGQYWNRVRGPLNVIDSTLIRDRGFTYAHPIKLKFTYKLRAFGNVNPKIAMMDLITNFLTLTYNSAEFWGGGIRYFQKTGFILPGIPSTKFENGDFIGGIQEVMKYVMGQVQEKGGQIASFLQEFAQGASEGDLNKVLKDIQKSDTAQKLAGSRIAQLMAVPLTMRSFLDGRAVGEWHLTVGNPMNPVAVIGNLCLTDTQIEFSEALGLDDFPTEVSFTVSLKPGRPRAKQDIESMLNLGAGPMSFTALPQTSSSFNSYGERNSLIENDIRKGTTTSTANSVTDKEYERVSSQAQVTEYTGDPGQKKDNSKVLSIADTDKLADYFRVNIARAYGSKFAQSPVLLDYFRDLKTKD